CIKGTPRRELGSMANNDRKALRRWTAALLLLSAVVPAAGCFRHHTIEPGSWRMSIDASRTSPQFKQYAPKPRDVEVAVDWGKEKGTEEIRVFFESKTGQGTRELKGKIAGGDIELKGVDQDWDLSFWGRVNNPQSMNGLAYGRGRINDQINFEGTW